MRNKLLLLILFLSMFNILLLVASERTLELTPAEKEYLKNGKVIRMCNNPNWIPIEFVENDIAKGITMDVLKLVEQKLGGKIKFEHLFSESWSQSQQFLKEKKCDILPAAIKTSKREKYAIFTQPYLDYELAVITKNDKPFIRNLEDCIDKSIARKKGSGLITKLKNKYKNVIIVQTKNYLESFQEVSSGEVYSTIATLPVASYYINKYALRNLQIAGYTNMRYKLRIAVRDDKPLLKSILDKALNQISPKEHKTIYDRWANPHITQKFDWSYIFYAAGGVLLIFLLFAYRQYFLIKQNKRLDEQYQYTNSILNSQTNFTIITDGRNIIETNQTTLDFFGYKTIEDFRKDHSCICDFFIEEEGYISNKEDWDTWSEFFIDNSTNLLLAKIKDLQGNIHVFQINSKGIQTEKNLIVITFTDITNLIQTKEKLKKSELKYRQMVEHSRDAIVIRQKGKFVFVNDAFAQMLGYSKEELLTIDNKQIFSVEILQNIEERILQKKDHETFVNQFEISMIKKDGTKIDVEINERIITFNNDKAQFAVIRDITKQKEIMKVLKRGAEQTKGLNEFIPICAGCSLIRDDEKEEKPWVKPADYITERLPNIKFSHTMCPDCLKKLYPDLEL